MPKDKHASRARIVTAARKEFLEKGFEKASMRTIAQAAGMTSAGLYRHFADKEAMFSALVEPLMEELQEMCSAMEARNYGFLEKGTLDEMWDGEAELVYLLPLVYRYFEEFGLLLCCSSGTRYGNFIHDFVTLEQEKTMEFLAAARQKGWETKEIDPRELHLLLSAYTSAFFEIVIHKFTKEEAEHYLSTFRKFFYPGWRAVFKCTPGS